MTVTPEQNIQTETADKPATCKRACNKARIIGCSIYFLVLCIFVLPTNILSILFGIGQVEECNSEPMDLGLYLIVTGCFGIFAEFLLLIVFIEKTCTTLFGICFSSAAALFQVSWILVGAVSLFTSYHHCHKHTIWSTSLVFWLLNIPVVLFYLTILGYSAATFKPLQRLITTLANKFKSTHVYDQIILAKQVETVV